MRKKRKSRGKPEADTICRNLKDDGWLGDNIEKDLSGNGGGRVGKGTLYVVATPIGNLSDLTFRALDILKSVDWIVCEDTRRTLKLLNHYGVRKPLVTIFGPKEKRESFRIMKLLERGESVALLSDAGTPAISDPGSYIVKEAVSRGIRVEPVPGTSALACAVSVSGMVEKDFIFLGFLHRKNGKIKKELSAVKDHKMPIVFFESPFRVVNTLTVAAEILGKDASCWIGREMTKKFEEYLSGPLEDVLSRIKQREMMGEFTVIVKPE